MAVCVTGVHHFCTFGNGYINSLYKHIKIHPWTCLLLVIWVCLLLSLCCGGYVLTLSLCLICKHLELLKKEKYTLHFVTLLLCLNAFVCPYSWHQCVYDCYYCLLFCMSVVKALNLCGLIQNDLLFGLYFAILWFVVRVSHY